MYHGCGGKEITIFPSWWRDEDLVVVIDIGIDESQSGSMLVVSAIVGNTRSMRKLDSEWRRELNQSGVDYFHAKDHWNPKASAYHGINKDARERLLNKLVRHLHRRFLFGASAIIDQEQYRNLNSDRFRSQYGSPYGWGFQLVMLQVLLELHMQERLNQPVNILIEDGHKNCQQVIGLIKEKTLKSSQKGLLVNSYGLGCKLKHPILQAADLLAFGICEAHVKGYSDFAARLIPEEYRRRFVELPWDQSSAGCAVRDIEYHARLLKAGAPAARRRTELVMW